MKAYEQTLKNAGKTVHYVDSVHEHSDCRKLIASFISHKDELQSRVTDILQVVKENGFTTYETTKDFVLE